MVTVGGLYTVTARTTYFERPYGVGLRRLPRQNNTVRSDLPDDVQADGVLRSDQTDVLPVVALKQNRFPRYSSNGADTIATGDQDHRRPSATIGVR